jgi:hypothetical protein
MRSRVPKGPASIQPFGQWLERFGGQLSTPGIGVRTVARRVQQAGNRRANGSLGRSRFAQRAGDRCRTRSRDRRSNCEEFAADGAEQRSRREASRASRADRESAEEGSMTNSAFQARAARGSSAALADRAPALYLRRSRRRPRGRGWRFGSRVSVAVRLVPGRSPLAKLM